MRRAAAAWLAVFAAWRAPAAAQAGYPPGALQHAALVERIASDVVSRSNGAEVRRAVMRTAGYDIDRQGDTMVVSADSVALAETSHSVTRTLDTGGFVGGRWKLLIDSTGNVRVVSRPFVPESLVEVSDLAAAMDDFLPPAPPPIAAGAAATDVGGRRWTRLTDSAGAARYRWAADHQSDSTSYVADSVAMHVRESTHEASTLAWDVRRGPLAWQRRIETTVTTQLRGRTIDATVDQHIAVTRVD